MEASYIGLRHPELYGYLGSFTFLKRIDAAPKVEDNPHMNAFKDPLQFSKDYKLFFRSCGDIEKKFYDFEDDDRFLKECGIDQLPIYVRKIYHNQEHVWNNWRRALIDFVQLLFKDDDNT